MRFERGIDVFADLERAVGHELQRGIRLSVVVSGLERSSEAEAPLA